MSVVLCRTRAYPPITTAWVWDGRRQNGVYERMQVTFTTVLDWEFWGTRNYLFQFRYLYYLFGGHHIAHGVCLVGALGDNTLLRSFFCCISLLFAWESGDDGSFFFFFRAFYGHEHICNECTLSH